MRQVYSDHRALRLPDTVPLSFVIPDMLSRSLRRVEDLSDSLDITTLSISFENGPWPEHYEWRLTIEGDTDDRSGD